DEIGNMSANVQAKLLRVLEEGVFMRLGGTRPIKVDVRIIAATNSNLKEAVARGQFRDDLFYRLNVVTVYLPALRDRKEDILPLALDLVSHFNKELKKNFTGFTPAAADLIVNYPWPGNIRELKNVVERAMILSPEGAIDAEYLPEEIRDHVPENAVAAASAAGAPADSTYAGSDSLETDPATGRKFVTLRELEQRYIDEVLAATGNNKTQAAKILGIHPTSLLRRQKKQEYG
ncbi:MAG TPA: sigma 54-interacting transcriptional regulator, partial [Terriglobales bacterium]|nr:sigma 54-interacting transcriptional regulator [Terriglobales bacterium]